MFYDEEMLLEIRLNILNDFVDYFVIVESNKFHNGNKRKLKFDINKFSKFKDKIIYIIHDENFDQLQKINPSDNEDIKSYKLIFNAHSRENDQRNFISKGLERSSDDDLVLISDVDEIPNLENIDLHNIKNKILMFEQNIFYYKLNRFLPNFKWYGTKACKKKYLINPQWLRNIKSKKYPFYRIDTLFSNSRYIDKYYVENGGWHFSNLKNSVSIELKLKSYLHHRDYEVEELGIDKINKLISENKTIYDMFSDKTTKKFGDKSRKTLEKFDIKKLPSYIQDNIEKFREWVD
tara:strand:+ start:806 stop:1681 length:876 start_codon:yes stop_codon:yes gene_type:complete